MQDFKVSELYLIDRIVQFNGKIELIVIDRNLYLDWFVTKQRGICIVTNGLGCNRSAGR
jgi:hypothetical protein